MARVLVTRRLTPGGTDPLREAGHEIVTTDDDVPLTAGELATQAAGCDGIVCLLTDRIDAAVLQAGHDGRLRVVANAAVADQPEGGAMYVAGQMGVEAPAGPTTVSKVILGFGGRPRGGEDEEEGEVGRRRIEDTGGVAYRDAQ